ncbi:reverse transcriptase domain-containing protein [Tanacetum coccineum]|uniref:Reverse transcriptase domain-containing protein n=1 Tax=Tanacetum coccineum TaxID=301880 RepID=A0ABQ4ZEB1_9ASTR
MTKQGNFTQRTPQAKSMSDNPLDRSLSSLGSANAPMIWLGQRRSPSDSPPSSDSEDSRRKRRRRVSSSSEDSSDNEDGETGHWKSKNKYREDEDEDMSRPWRRQKVNAFTRRISDFSEDKKRRMPANVKTYDGTSDPDDHLKIFESAATIENWPQPVWCHMFNSTLVGNARTVFTANYLRKAFMFERVAKGIPAKFYSKRCCHDPCPRLPELIKRLNDSVSTKPLMMINAQGPSFKESRRRGQQKRQPNNSHQETVQENNPMTKVQSQQQLSSVRGAAGERQVHPTTQNNDSKGDTTPTEGANLPQATTNAHSRRQRVGNGYCEYHRPEGPYCQDVRPTAPQLTKLVKGRQIGSPVKNIKEGKVNQGARPRKHKVTNIASKDCARSKKSVKPRHDSVTASREKKKWPMGHLTYRYGIMQKSNTMTVSLPTQLWSKKERWCWRSAWTSPTLTKHVPKTAIHYRDRLESGVLMMRIPHQVLLGPYKWSVLLGEHNISYRPRTAVKGQILADFLIEKPETDVVLPQSEVKLQDPWILFTDRSSCVDGSGAGLILTNPEGMEFTYALRFEFSATNNEAEYEALIAGLRIAARMGVRNLEANVDSRLVANHVLGEYVAKEDNMIQYLDKTKSLIQSFDRFTIRQVPRGDNKKADALSKIASTSFAHLSKQVLVEILKNKSIAEMEISTVIEEQDPTWMTPIIEFISKGTLPLEQKEARRIRRTAQRFELRNGILYRRSFLQPWLRCVGPIQADYVLREIHAGSCSMHSGPRSVVARALRSGYYWPTMHRDARDMIRKCHDCQQED